MRKNKNRTLILSIASAAAVMPGCGDSYQEFIGTTVAPADAGNASDEGTSVGMSGSFVAPADAGDEHRIPGSTIQPADAGDEKPIMIGSMVDPRDGGPFPGVIIMPQDGSAKG
jgi:hypothetical protein